MPWDPTNVKVFDTQRPQKIALDTVRSGCYKRAVAILQSTERTGTQQATAESLHRLLQAAGAENIQAEIPEQDAQFLYQEQVNAEAARQDKLQAKANKQQLRRERQQRRHEQKMAVRQQRYDDKVKARQKDFKQQISKRRTQQESSLQQLKEQQRSLQEQLADHQQSSAQLLNSAPVESSEHALAALQKELQDAQTSKAQAEEQLQLACNTSEEMSRRAASIEPEDGECTPSPVAVEQSSEAHRHAQLGQVPTQPMEPASQADSLPPPPAVASGNAPAGLLTQSNLGTAASNAPPATSRHRQHSFQQEDFTLPPPPPIPR